MIHLILVLAICGFAAWLILQIPSGRKVMGSRSKENWELVACLTCILIAAFFCFMFPHII